MGPSAEHSLITWPPRQPSSLPPSLASPHLLINARDTKASLAPSQGFCCCRVGSPLELIVSEQEPPRNIAEMTFVGQEFLHLRHCTAAAAATGSAG